MIPNIREVLEAKLLIEEVIAELDDTSVVDRPPYIQTCIDYLRQAGEYLEVPELETEDDES